MAARCEARVKTEDSTATIFRIVGHDDQMDELAILWLAIVSRFRADLKSRARMRKAPAWQKGQSSNPRGRPAGSKHRATVFAETLLAGEAEGIVRKVVTLALAGDPACLKLCMDRLLPPLKSRPVNFPLPTLRTTSDALAALAGLAQGIATGRLLPEEAESLTVTISTFLKAVEVAEFEDRLAALEKDDAEGASRELSFDAKGCGDASKPLKNSASCATARCESRTSISFVPMAARLKRLRLSQSRKWKSFPRMAAPAARRA
jgi:Family of unknown function (DUF5681)